ncbi:MAG: hydantoinase/oxoprolinase family protein [Rhodobacteraceae bacterium]|nr:hydantoinase/oxoprolinase family protein [Paracoccaceae bacterium]
MEDAGGTGEGGGGALLLGLDTGGTYTDAVLWREGSGLVAKAKALTTHGNLAEGIAAAIDRVLAAAGAAPEAVALVSMSTTLATNALVEGKGERIALVLIGFDPSDLARGGLAAALDGDPVIHCQGGHDAMGGERPLDLGPLRAALPALADRVSGFAVCALFAVRNPAHELAAQAEIERLTGRPVTLSHELSARLDGPRRALTTVMNARLVPIIARLIADTRAFLGRRGIAAPLVVVRGDGSLVSADFAGRRPVETILSGPAASVVGAHHLSGLDEAFISDIGGTTTDVACLEAGRPRLDPAGATVGGHRTLVEAVEMRTFGLGGDSEVAFAEGEGPARFRFGPRRILPLSLAAARHEAEVMGYLSELAKGTSGGQAMPRMLLRLGADPAGLSPAERALLDRIGDRPVPAAGAAARAAEKAAVERLVRRGQLQVIGFTPSDAAHVLGRQATWHAEAARAGAALIAAQRDGRGLPRAASAEALAADLLAAFTRRSAEVILETALCEDGIDGASAVRGRLISDALDGRRGRVRLSVALDRPVVGVGASAGLHYAGLPALLNVPCRVPADADVANAVGAVVGRVTVRAETLVTQPAEGRFRVTTAGGAVDLGSEDLALARAAEEARAQALARALAAGAEAPEVSERREVQAATVEGRRVFIEARVVATASGRPRHARPAAAD